MALSYGTSTSLTITAGGLTNGSNRASAAVTTTTGGSLTEILLDVNILTTTSAPSGSMVVSVYGYYSEDGTIYTGASGTVDNVDGTDKALAAIGSPTNLVFIGNVYMNAGANAVTIHKQFELIGIFGCIPRKWGIVLVNSSGVTLGATVTATYTEVSQ